MGFGALRPEAQVCAESCYIVPSPGVVPVGRFGSCRTGSGQR